MSEKRQILDLVHKENSTIDYEVITFPDGQVHFKMGEISHKYPVDVKCRIRNGNELFLLLQVLDVLNRHGVRPRVFIYYLLGARMDRVMSFGEPFTANVVLDMLDKFDAIYCMEEAHCDELIRKYGNYSPKWINSKQDIRFGDDDSVLLCCPDEGASSRYAAGRWRCLVCGKKRDTETGALSGFEVANPEVFKEGERIKVVDDLIDGGGTFCGLIGELRKLNPSKVILQVVHAIQKEGIERVAALYDEVCITNSYHDWDKEDLPKNVFVKDIIQ